MRRTAIVLGILMTSCTVTSTNDLPDTDPPSQKIMLSSIGGEFQPPFMLPPITITAPREQKEVKRDKSQQLKSPCADISTGDVKEDIRAKLDCLVKLVE